MWIVSRNMSNKFKSFVLFLKILVTLVLSRNFYKYSKQVFKSTPISKVNFEWKLKSIAVKMFFAFWKYILQ